MPKKAQRINTERKIAVLKPLFTKREKVLDFGCGDLSLSEALHHFNPSLQLTGIDVVDFKKRPPRVQFKKYNGVKIPFKSNTFDTVLVYQVFHHCKNVEALLQECARVGKRIIISEPICRSPFEIPGMKFMDWFWNAWKREPINLPYRFYSLREWEGIIKKNNLKIISKKNVDKFLPKWIPIGRTYLFVVEKK